MRTDERAWRIGADGEEAVAARPARLGDRWKGLHAVPVGDKAGDIDHVVIGPLEDRLAALELSPA